jgi:uncharacterized repeat protein (TIGR01451 family)
MSASNPNVFDTKMDRVTIATVGDLSLQPNRVAPLNSGGTVAFSHTLANIGNTGFNQGLFVYTTPFSAFGAQLYVDVDGNGVLDGNDRPLLNNDLSDILALIPSLGGSFDPGDSVTIFAVVSAPSATTTGLTETAVLEIQAIGDTNPNNNSVTETVTLATGNLEVLKEQARDDDCNGVANSAFSTAPLTADPGQCILYRVIATNVGSRNAENVRIDDEVPTYTRLMFGPNATGGTAAQVDPAFNGSSGMIRSIHGTLIPSGRATLTFGVQIDN